MIKYFTISNMSCAACVANITKKVESIDKDYIVNVSLLNLSMTVEANSIDVAKIIKVIKDIGYDIKEDTSSLEDTAEKIKKMHESKTQALKKQKKVVISSLCILIVLMYFSMGHMINILPPFLAKKENGIYLAIIQLILTLPIIFLFRNLIFDGFKAFLKRVPNMNSLIAFGSIAALLYSIVAIVVIILKTSQHDYETSHKFLMDLYLESSAMVLTLVSLGKYLENKSKLKTSSAITNLVELQPKKAILLTSDKQEVEILAKDIKQGDIIVIKPGAVIPVDGEIIDGNTAIDESNITGESIPVDKIVGDKVFVATINTFGNIKVSATHVGQDSSLNQIITLVENANSKKAQIAQIADKISLYFVPAVLLISLMVFLSWIISTKNISLALTFSISVLVISCPCALGLATPVAIMVGTGKGAKSGILIKSPNVLQELSKSNTIVFDKTGTITIGTPNVFDLITTSNLNKAEILQLLGSIEELSEHPIAKAIANLKNYLEIPSLNVSNFKAIIGNGVIGEINNISYIAGNSEVMKNNHIDTSKYDDIVTKYQTEGKTVIYFSDSKNLLGIITLKDAIKNSSKDAIKILKSMQKEVIMLTGDNSRTANAIKNELDIDTVISEVKPNEKSKFIESLQKENKTVVMVGDGINDSIALSSANVGISLGSGTDIAIESGDIILIKNDLIDVANAIKLSKKTFITIKENLFWAFCYNVIAIPIAAGVFYSLNNFKLSPMIAALAMSISSVTVVLNSLRIDSTKLIRTKNQNNKNNILVNNIDTIKDEVKKINLMENKMKKLYITIDGMMCTHCSSRVEQILNSIDGLSNAKASHESKKAIADVSKDVDTNIIKDEITKIGYNVLDISIK